MKRDSLLSIILFITLLVSVGLTYVSINSHEFYQFLTSRIDGETAETVQENTTLAGYDVTEFYDPNPLELKNVIRPHGYYYHESDNFYWLNQSDIQQTISAYFSSRPIVVDEPNDVYQAENIFSLFTDDYLEIVFPELLPLGLITNYVGIDNPDEALVLINQILIPFDDAQTVYLINSHTGQYVKGKLTEQLTKNELQAVIANNKGNYVPVTRYYGRYHYIYLPTESIERQSRLYTLEELPENLFISQVFAGDSEPQIVSTSNTSTIYRNYRFSLEINNASKRLDFMISRIDDGNQSNLIEGIEDSFYLIKQYEYWPGDVRLTSIKNGRITYRHFIDNMPIFTAETLPDYGSSIVHLRNDQSYGVYRYQTTLLVPQAYIEGVSQNYTLPSDQDIIAYLVELGLSTDDFNYATIGYEWQLDMEDFQKVILVPKWYFSLDGQQYSLEQLATEQFRNHYAEVFIEQREEQ